VLSRFLNYVQRNGASAILPRIATSLRRARSGSWMVLYSCDLPEMSRVTAPILDVPLEISRHFQKAEISPAALEKILSIGQSSAMLQRIEERFARGASLWLLWNAGQVAGFGWTIAGTTIEPHYFPLLPEDVHLFDFFVFPEFRGRGLNPVLVNYILCRLGAEQKRRALVEAARWNTPQLHSLQKTPFRRIGMARKHFSRTRIAVIWSRMPISVTP
jgi:GNAT superfamily N-acetyltransferase